MKLRPFRCTVPPGLTQKYDRTSALREFNLAYVACGSLADFRRTSACQLYPESGGIAAEHASAQRSHAREEGIAFGSATLHGDKIHEDRAFIADAVDIGGFPNH